MALVFWDSWVAMGLFTAAAWGLSCVIDVCFVGAGVFRRPADGPLVAGLFCGVPLFTVGGAEDVAAVDARVALVAALAGVCYLLHLYFYFKALFALNDAPNAEIFNTLSVLFVPVLAFMLLGEVLDPLHYVAIGLAVVGICALVRLQLSRMSWRVTALLSISVLCVSAVMVMQAWVLRHVPYGVAIWLFSLSAFVGVAGVAAAHAPLRRSLVDVCRRFGPLLVAVQLLELGAVLASQRATDVGPSVSLVALVECTLPVFVMAFSWALLHFVQRWRVIGSDGIRSALAMQTTAYPAKLLSLVLIITAVFLIQP